MSVVQKSPFPTPPTPPATNYKTSTKRTCCPTLEAFQIPELFLFPRKSRRSLVPALWNNSASTGGLSPSWPLHWGSSDNAQEQQRTIFMAHPGTEPRSLRMVDPTGSEAAQYPYGQCPWLGFALESSLFGLDLPLLPLGSANSTSRFPHFQGSTLGVRDWFFRRIPAVRRGPEGTPRLGRTLQHLLQAQCLGQGAGTAVREKQEESPATHCTLLLAMQGSTSV